MMIAIFSRYFASSITKLITYSPPSPVSFRISRGESNQPRSKVHFFTSHFMTTLKDKGVDAVASWTVNKKINVFEKKLIFIPVNADLHWSLCVVVNPGLIANSFNGEGSPYHSNQEMSWYVTLVKDSVFIRIGFSPRYCLQHSISRPTAYAQQKYVCNSHSQMAEQ